MLCVFPYIIGSILLFVVSIEVYLGYDSQFFEHKFEFNGVVLIVAKFMF